MSIASNPNKPQGYWRIPEYLSCLDAELINRLEMFYWDLLKFNQRLNLISRRTEIDADVTHMLDSLLGGQIVLDATKATTIHDIGSGNGLPGMIMALLDPQRQFVLVDSDERKCEFLKVMATRLGATNVTVEKKRLESFAPLSINCAVSRGFGNLSRTILMARKPMPVGGEYFHFKGSSWVREVAEIPSQICSFWAPRLVKEYELPIVAARMAIVATKRIG